MEYKSIGQEKMSNGENGTRLEAIEPTQEVPKKKKSYKVSHDKGLNLMLQSQEMFNMKEKHTAEAWI